MKIGLVSYEFKNNDIAYNMSQIEKAMKNNSGEVSLLCFGESFLQGFDTLNWHFAHDKRIALATEDNEIVRLCELTKEHKVDLIIGYFERCEDNIYSSCIVIENGSIIKNYRRISKGWKEYTKTDYHYQEGNLVEEFNYKGKKMMIALCGDLWDYPDRFKGRNILIWPVYVNFSLEDWAEFEHDYAEQAGFVSEHVLMINSLSKEPKSCGGSFYFRDGKIEKKIPFDEEGILIVDI